MAGLLVLYKAPGFVDAGFTASPVAWDSTFENDPDNTDSVSLGDDHLRQLKQEIGEALEAVEEAAPEG